MNPDRIDPSVQRLLIANATKASNVKAGFYTLLGIVLGGAGATITHVVLAARLVDICI